MSFSGLFRSVLVLSSPLNSRALAVVTSVLLYVMTRSTSSGVYFS